MQRLSITFTSQIMVYTKSKIVPQVNPEIHTRVFHPESKEYRLRCPPIRHSHPIHYELPYERIPIRMTQHIPQYITLLGSSNAEHFKFKSLNIEMNEIISYTTNFHVSLFAFLLYLPPLPLFPATLCFYTTTTASPITLMHIYHIGGVRIVRIEKISPQSTKVSGLYINQKFHHTKKL